MSSYTEPSLLLRRHLSTSASLNDTRSPPLRLSSPPPLTERASGDGESSRRPRPSDGDEAAADKHLLRWSTIFRCSQVYQAVPPAQLTLENRTLSPLDCHITVVGCAGRDLLVSYRAFMPTGSSDDSSSSGGGGGLNALLLSRLKTHIGLYRIRERTLDTLYVNRRGTCDVLGASYHAKLRLLALTIKVKSSSDGPSPSPSRFKYISYLINLATTMVARLKDSDVVAECRLIQRGEQHDQRGVGMVLIRHGRSIRQYFFWHKLLAMSEPSKSKELHDIRVGTPVRDFLWCQWDEQQHLHVLLYNDKRRLVLRGLSFSQREHRVLFEFPLDSLAQLVDESFLLASTASTATPAAVGPDGVATTDALDLDEPDSQALLSANSQSPSLQSMTASPTGEASGKKTSKTTRWWISEFGRLVSTSGGQQMTDCLFTLVLMRQGGLCLCVQHPPPPNQRFLTSIKVTVFVLHKYCQLTLSIPLNRMSSTDIVRTRVFFDQIADALLIFVPGHHIQFLDVPVDHPPMLSLALSGPDNAPPLPSQKYPAAANVTRFLLPSTSFRFPPASGRSAAATGSDVEPPLPATEPDRRRHTVFDPAKGRAYEFIIDRGRFLPLFEQRPSALQAQALHFAVVHMQDEELADQIVAKACRNWPHNLTYQVVVEFLLSVTYHHALHNLKFPAYLLDCLPVSSLPALDQPNYAAGGVSSQLLSGYTIVHESRNPPSSASKKSPIGFEVVPSSPTTPSPVPPSPDRSTVSSSSSLSSSTSTSSSSSSLSASSSLSSSLSSSSSSSSSLSSSAGTVASPAAAVVSATGRAAAAVRRRADRSTTATALRASNSFCFVESDDGALHRNAYELPDDLLPNPQVQPFNAPPTQHNLSSSPSSAMSTLKRWAALLSTHVMSTPGQQAPPASSSSSSSSGTASEQPDRSDYVDALVQHWLALYPRENQAKLVELARQYRLGQMNAVRRFFRHVRVALSHVMQLDFVGVPADLFEPPTQLLHSYFGVLETLYCVLEEHHLPYPYQFHRLRFFLGFRCLPRETFVHYLDNDVLFPDLADIRSLLLALAERRPPPDDVVQPPFSINGRLERALFGRLPLKVQVSLLAALPPSPDVDRALFQSSNYFMAVRPHFVDYDRTEESSFVPLAAWQESVRAVCADSMLSTRRDVRLGDFLSDYAAHTYAPLFPKPKPRDELRTGSTTEMNLIITL